MRAKKKQPEVLGDAPIEDNLRGLMNKVAGVLDSALNPFEGDKKQGFILMLFPFEGHKGRCNYISNAKRRDVVIMLKEQIARFEGQPEIKGRA
jgi:hypothetical protein